MRVRVGKIQPISAGRLGNGQSEKFGKFNQFRNRLRIASRPLDEDTGILRLDKPLRNGSRIILARHDRTRDAELGG